MINIERMVNQTLWYTIMDEKYQGEEEFENDTFMVRPYCWNDCDEENRNEYHFWHKPSNLKIYWYKYPMRSARANMPITNEQFYAVLHDCMNSVHEHVKDGTFEPWWEEKDLSIEEAKETIEDTVRILSCINMGELTKAYNKLLNTIGDTND